MGSLSVLREEMRRTARHDFDESRFWSTDAEAGFDLTSDLREDLLGIPGRDAQKSRFWSNSAVLEFGEAPTDCSEENEESSKKSLKELLLEEDEANLETAPRRPSTVPFQSDFSLRIGDFQLHVNHDLCQPHASPVSGIALFFPGIAGPGSDEGLLRSVARTLVRSMNAPIDCYHLFWDENRDPALDANSAIPLVRHALNKAMRHVSATKPHQFRLFFVGHGVGGARALEAALLVQGLASRDIQVSGICTLNSECPQEIKKNKKFLTPLSNARALVIAGDSDVIVKPDVSCNLHSTLPMEDKELLIIPGGTHDLSLHQPQLVRNVSGFIMKGLK